LNEKRQDWLKSSITTDAVRFFRNAIIPLSDYMMTINKKGQTIAWSDPFFIAYY